MNALVRIPDVAASDDVDFEFDFNDKTIRGRLMDGVAWFVAGDVAASIGQRNASDMTRSLDDDEKGTHTLRTLGGVQTVLFISEPGLYRATLQRRTTTHVPAATRERIRAFQKLVAHEILPSIRRTGSYSTAPAPLPFPAQIDVRDQAQLAVIASQLVALTSELRAQLGQEQARLGQEQEAHAETHAHLEDTTKLLRIESHARQVTSVALSEAHGRIDAQRPAVLAQERLAVSDDCLSLSEAAVVLLIPRQPLLDYLLALGYLTHIASGSRERLRCTQAGVASGWVRMGRQDHGPRPNGPLRGLSSHHPVVTSAGLAGLGEHFCRGVRATRQPVIPGM